MKKIILFSLCIISANLVAGSAWRREQIAGRTGRGAQSQARRAVAGEIRPQRNVPGVTQTRGTGRPGSRQNYGLQKLETSFIPKLDKGTR